MKNILLLMTLFILFVPPAYSGNSYSKVTGFNFSSYPIRIVGQTGYITIFPGETKTMSASFLNSNASIAVYKCIATGNDKKSVLCIKTPTWEGHNRAARYCTSKGMGVEGGAIYYTVFGGPLNTIYFCLNAHCGSLTPHIFPADKCP